MGTDKIHILVVDDDEDDIYLICDTISECPGNSYSVRTSHKPSEAAEILRQGGVDIVLCDYVMGSITGIDFITASRAEGIDVPIILLTGMAAGSADQAALEAGASDFISKTNMTPEVIDRAIRYSIANAERQRLFQTVLDNVNAAVALIDRDQQPTLWNPEFGELARAHAKDCGCETHIEAFAKDMLAAKRTISIGGRVLDKNVSNTPDNGVVIILHDVTEHVEALREREKAENRAAHLAMNCSLTSLPNRNAFSERINQEISAAKSEGREFYLLNLDLNKFKEVNDIYGHKTGDLLLVEVAKRLSDCCRGNDYIARLGGDEFMAIQSKTQDSEDLPSLARRIAHTVDTSILLDDTLVRTGVSIGVAVYPDHGQTAEELMSKADIAMYRAKADPINRIYAYDEEMDRNVRETMKIGQELRKTVESGLIDVYFQPQANFERGETIGFEALARWNHPELGPIPPSTFIPIAEDNGLITGLGELALTRACEIAASWDNSLSVAVNISPVQIRHVDLPALVHSVLLKTGLPPSRLELEVTESVLIDDANRALHALRGIKNLGVSIALDDFGTGYSSLSTLISFPFDKIKIDRSFVEQLGQNHQADVIIRAIIGMAHQLGFKIIAEGVENRDQIEFLLRERCHEMQGFFIGQPVPPGDIEQFLASPETSEVRRHDGQRDGAFKTRHRKAV